MGPPSYVWSLVDRNVVMRRITVYQANYNDRSTLQFTSGHSAFLSMSTINAAQRHTCLLQHSLSIFFVNTKPLK